jgi:hypothetical protein
MLTTAPLLFGQALPLKPQGVNRRVIGLLVSLFMEFAYARRSPRDGEVVRERDRLVRERY